MLTPPKWHSVWLKSQYSSKNLSKTMFFKEAHSLFDELRKCCNSSSKDLTLEALSCWRVWIENQQEEDWRENEICYTAIRPLLTKKFHPLHRDVEVSETKLSLMWLALQKTQGLMHLEGPQHILEVFIQSCLTWLSCSEDVGFNMDDLILKLLRSLFSNNVEICQKREKFPPLNTNMWKTNKLFSRMVSLWLDIFQNWTKIKKKADLLEIWEHFLGHCEQSFKLIPVAVWHKIFKLVDSICSDHKELMRNKMSLLHKCATLLKSVLSNSKFIDCSQVLTTPAEALLKIVIDLSGNCKDENIPFYIFQYCRDISQILSSCIVHTFGYEFCFNMLCKIEDIESKPLMWGLWCGLVNCFRQQVNYGNSENYSKMEMKLFRKLRSVAVNFDLDRMMLEERSVILIEDQLNFLRIPKMCKNCSERDGTDEDATYEIQTSNSGSSFPAKEKYDFSGGFGFNVDAAKSVSCVCLSRATGASMEINMPESITTNSGNENKTCAHWRFQSNNGWFDVNKKWMAHHCGLNNPSVWRNFWFRFDNIHEERLITVPKGYWRRVLFAPLCLTVLLEELSDIARKDGGTSMDFIENIKKVETSVKEGEITTPIKLFLSVKGSKGVDICSNAVRFWSDRDEIINDLDLLKNLNLLKSKNNRSAVRLSMFLFLVNFAKNLYFQEREKTSYDLRKLDVEEILALRLVNFMRNVTDYKKRLTNFAFLDNICNVLPSKSDIVWTNFAAAGQAKVTESDSSILENASSQESTCRMTNDNLINIFKCFDEFESKLSKDDVLPITEKRKRRKKVSDASKVRRYSRRREKSMSVMPPAMENENVKVVPSSLDASRTVSFPERRTEIDFGEHEKLVKVTRKRRRNNKTATIPRDEMPRKRTRSSSKKNTSRDEMTETKQDENVNIENRKSNFSAATLRPLRKSSTDLKLSPKVIYFLRKRPFQRSSNSPLCNTKCICADDFINGKNLGKDSGAHNTERCTERAGDCSNLEIAREVSPENRNIKVFKNSESDMALAAGNLVLVKADNDSSGNSVSAIEEKIEEYVDVKVEKFKVLSDVKASGRIGETDLLNENREDEISKLVCSLVEKVEKAEDFNARCGNVKTELNRVEACDVPISDSFPIKTEDNRGVKRSLISVSDAVEGKKIKMEEEGQSLVPDVKQEEPVTVPRKAIQKSELPVFQSRGSRMLALVPESPKLHGFHDSYLSKHQTVRPPNVMKNSRASRMLALLPELQEPSSDVKSISIKETVTEKTADDDNTKRGINGNMVGIIHHLTPSRKGSAICSESLKSSPLRQRRSIRFDDDRNETVTYLTDSPPCQTIKQGTRFRGIDK